MEWVGRQHSPDLSHCPPQRKIKTEKKEWARGPRALAPLKLWTFLAQAQSPGETGEQRQEQDSKSYTTVFIFAPVFLFQAQEVTVAKGAKRNTLVCSKKPGGSAGHSQLRVRPELRFSSQRASNMAASHLSDIPKPQVDGHHDSQFPTTPRKHSGPACF